MRDRLPKTRDSTYLHLLTFFLPGLGQLLVFTSYVAHRSGANKSSSDRKAIYATYNRACEGDLRKGYYEHRGKEWPATHMRKEGESYAAGALTYGFGSPMLSVDEGKQVSF